MHCQLLTIIYTHGLAVLLFGEFVQPKLSLTEGSIPRTSSIFTPPILFGKVYVGIADARIAKARIALARPVPVAVV